DVHGTGEPVARPLHRVDSAPRDLHGHPPRVDSPQAMRRSAANRLEGGNEDDRDPALPLAAREQVGRHEVLVAAGADPDVDVRRPAELARRTRPLEPEGARGPGPHAAVAPPVVDPVPARLPELDDGALDRCAPRVPEDSAGEHVAGADSGTPRGG